LDFASLRQRGTLLATGKVSTGLGVHSGVWEAEQFPQVWLFDRRPKDISGPKLTRLNVRFGSNADIRPATYSSRTSSGNFATAVHAAKNPMVSKGWTICSSGKGSLAKLAPRPYGPRRNRQSACQDNAIVADEQSAEQPSPIEALVATPDLADALESEQFRRFLDQVPLAIIVSQMGAKERIVYVNPEFERVSGQRAASLEGKTWSVLQCPSSDDANLVLGRAITEGSDFLGTFLLTGESGEEQPADAYSNVIQDEKGVAAYRFAALVKVGIHKQEGREELEKRLREKDALLLEVQHRVKNNLQMITALMRIEARNADGLIDTAPFQRLAGRIEAIKILYTLLDPSSEAGEVDLGVYLSDVAAAVLHAHAVEGVRLELKVDAYPVSVNVAMPAGLVVNELLTNALKHAFVGRPGGTISLESVSDGNGCRVTVADNGVGLPEGLEWPKRGKLSALIVQSLRENAKAQVQVESVPGQGMRVTLIFTRAAAAPQTA
jgi:PAS domain S-box-containing protein